MKTTKETHYVYKITNLLTNEISLGITTINSTKIEDGYEKYRSQLIASIVLDGEANFKKEIFGSWVTKEEAQKEKNRMYRKNNKDSIKEIQKRSKEKNKIAIAIFQKEYNKKYRALNAEKLKEQAKIYRANNTKTLKARRSTYKKNNANKIKINDKIYRENNKDKIQAAQSEYYQIHKATIIQQSKNNYNLNTELSNIVKIKKGFLTTDYIFYTIKMTHKFSDTSFFKYGITKYDVKTRFSIGYSDFDIEILDLMYGCKDFVRAIEQKHLKESKNYTFIFPENITRLKSGSTECRTQLVSSLKIV